MIDWQPKESAPKDGMMILGVFSSYPIPLAAIWNGCDGMWVAAVPHVEPCDGTWNDWYFENEQFDDLLQWVDISQRKQDFTPG